MLTFYCSKINESDLNPSNPFAPNSHVLLSVSVISDRNTVSGKTNFYPESQSGAGFREMVETVIAEPNITQVTLFNTAYLQRHRLALELLLDGLSEEDAINKAERLAIEDRDEWEKQNKDAIELLKNKFGEKFKILDWTEIVIKNSGFSKRNGEVNTFFNGNSKDSKSFQKAVKESVEIFFQKLPSSIKDKLLMWQEQGKDLAKQKVMLYLRRIALEECSVRSLLDYSFEIYRGPGNVSVTMAYNRLADKTKMILVSIGNEVEIEQYKCEEERLMPKKPDKKDEMTSESRRVDDDKVEVKVIVFQGPLEKVSALLKDLGLFSQPVDRDSNVTRFIVEKP